MILNCERTRTAQKTEKETERKKILCFLYSNLLPVRGRQGVADVTGKWIRNKRSKEKATNTEMDSAKKKRKQTS